MTTITPSQLLHQVPVSSTLNCSPDKLSRSSAGPSPSVDQQKFFPCTPREQSYASYTIPINPIGTGLPEVILAAVVASSGKTTVLHLDAYEG